MSTYAVVVSNVVSNEVLCEVAVLCAVFVLCEVAVLLDVFVV